MSYRVTELNGIKTYNLSWGKTLPEFMEQSKKEQKSLRYNKDFRNRIELIQDFEFKVSCQQVCMTKDGKHILASGIYAPQVKIYDLKDLSMKCLRGMDSEVVKLLSLSHDYSKFVAGCQDRGLEFHAQYGRHFKTRVPRNIRNMDYAPFSCDLFIAGNASEVYRLNLEEGVFMAPFTSSNSTLEGLFYSPHLDILLAGGEQGIMEIFDYRQRHKAGELHMGAGITCIKGQPDGLQYLVGQQDGQVKLFDLRYSSSALLTINHQYRMPINTLDFHPKTNTILSTDPKVIKMTKVDTGCNFTSIEPGYCINQSTLVEDSGLVLVAGETQRIGQFFVPALDNAPKWCPFLENVTEELEEQHQELVYDEFKFLTKQDLEALGAVSLIGGKMLKSYMHGYLMHLKLYNKLKMASDPFKYETYRKQQIKEKMNASTKQRIVIKQKKKAINQEYFDELNKKKVKAGDLDVKQALEKDDRFSKLFTEKNFNIDKTTEDYRINNPSRGQKPVNQLQNQQTEEDFQKQISQKKSKEVDIKKQKQIDMQESFEHKINKIKKKSKGIRKGPKVDRFFKQ